MPIFPIRTDAPLIEGPPQGQWTLADWEKLGTDEGMYEVIAGNLYLTRHDHFFHPEIGDNLVGRVGYPMSLNNLGIDLLMPIVVMPNCDPVLPDYGIVKKERAEIIHDRRIYGVPDLIVEILSPSNRAYDETTKMNAYAAAGLPEFGVVDPMSKQLRIFELDVPGQFREARVFHEADTAHVSCLPTIEFKVGDLFAGAPDTTL